MKYEVTVGKQIRVLVAYVVDARSPAHALDVAALGKVRAAVTQIDDPLTASASQPAQVELVDDVDDRLKNFEQTPIVDLPPDDPLVGLLETLSMTIISPNPIKTVKMGRGNSAVTKTIEPDPIQLSQALEYDERLWACDMGIFDCEHIEYRFVRLIPRHAYDHRLPVRTHNHNHYQSNTGLLVRYRDHEYVILETEHIGFRIAKPQEEPEG